MTSNLAWMWSFRRWSPSWLSAGGRSAWCLRTGTKTTSERFLGWFLFIKGLKVYYGSPMTLALVEHKLRERGLLDRAELITVTPNTSWRSAACVSISFR